jgi:hypothetical protein
MKENNQGSGLENTGLRGKLWSSAYTDTFDEGKECLSYTGTSSWHCPGG